MTQLLKGPTFAWEVAQVPTDFLHGQGKKQEVAKTQWDAQLIICQVKAELLPASSRVQETQDLQG